MFLSDVKRISASRFPIGRGGGSRPAVYGLGRELERRVEQRGFLRPKRHRIHRRSASASRVKSRWPPPCRKLSDRGNLMHRSSTVQTRGRVTLPREVRRALHVAPGDDVVFVQTAPGCFEVRAEGRKAALLNRPRASRGAPVDWRRTGRPLTRSLLGEGVVDHEHLGG